MHFLRGMRNLFFGLLSVVLIFTGTVQVKAYADEEMSSELLTANVDVTLYKDGRIKGLENPEELSKFQREEILKLMKFTEEEIETFSNELENDLLVDGGVKVELEISDFIHTYTDSKGVTYTVTEENVAEINEIKQRDLGKLNNNNQIGIYGSHTEGIFTGKGVLTYLGSDSTVYKYKYRTTFDWSSMPALRFTDSIGHSWQYHTTSKNTTADYRRYSNGYFSHTDRISFDRSNVAGSKASIDLDGHAGQHYGYIEDEVWIPKTNKDTPGQFASAYGHSYFPSTIVSGISINILGYGSINLSGTGDYFTWKNNFTIGQTTSNLE